MKNLFDILLKLGVPLASFYALFVQAIPWYCWPPIVVSFLYIVSRYDSLMALIPDFKRTERQLRGLTPEDKPCTPSLDAAQRDKLAWRHAQFNQHGKVLVRAEDILGWLYHPVPLHPQGLPRAMMWALIYTVFFWWFPWLLGGSGQLSQAKLLPDIAIWQRWLLAMVIFGLPFFQLRLQSKFKQWWPAQSELVTHGLALTLSFMLLMLGCITAGVASLDRVLTLGVGIGAISSHGVFMVAIFAVAVAYAVAFAGAVAGAGAGAFAVAGAVAVAGAGAVAFAFAFAFAGAGAGAGAFAVAFVLFDMAIRADTNLAWRDRVWRTLALWLLWLPLILPIACAPLWLPQVITVQDDWARADGRSFASFFFLGLLPWLNAAFDFASVSATLALLRRYSTTRLTGWWMLVLDIAIAVVLTVLLYGTVLLCLVGLERVGWGVVAKELIAGFTDPASLSTNSPALWLWLLALTNIAPTFLHMGLTLWALLIGRLSKARFRIGDWQKQLAKIPPEALLPTDSIALTRFLLIDGWLTALFVLSLLPIIYVGFLWLLPKLIGALFL